MRIRTTVLCLATSVVLARSPANGEAVDLRTEDGLSLALSADGRVADVTIGDRRLGMEGKGGFALADFQNQPEPANLVPNAGFEDGVKSWRLAKGQTIDTGLVRAGRFSVRIHVPPDQPRSSNVECRVPVKPNTRYRASLWVRRKEVGVCGAYVSERNDQNKLTGKRTQVGAAIPKKDGVWHQLHWELVTQPETTRLSLRSDIYRSFGTLWLDDFVITEVAGPVYQPITGRLERGQEGTAFRGSLPDVGLDLDATLKSDEECVRVDGVVRDTTGRDRAVAVRFGLPLDLTGWTWYLDSEERETIQAPKAYRYTYECQSGIGECSVYPWSALSGPRGGLTFALPLSQGPRVFIVQHDQRLPEASITFYFGLTKHAGHHPNCAPFSFVIYRHDPRWGMRSAMERYYRLFPESFVKRPTYEGYLNYANLERFDPKTHRIGAYGSQVSDASDFGEGYKFVWHLHGCYDFRMVPYDDPKRPDDVTIMGLLQQMVERETKKPRYYTPTAETIKKICHGSEGQFLYIGDTRYWRPQEGYNRTNKPGWGLNFRVNEDPGVSDALAKVSRRRAEAYAKDQDRRPFDAWFTADAIEGYFANRSGLNYRREHFKTTLVPLTFGKQSLRPAMPNTIWDFLHKCWWPLTQEFQILTHGNANCYEQAFTLPYVDIPMTEGNWDRDHPGRLDRYMRAMVYQKIWRYWRAWHRVTGVYGEKDPASVRTQFHRGLAYAVFPCMGPLRSSTGDIEPYRAWFRQFVPAIEELSAAGWEPVPHARATEGAVVERYGSFADGQLHFALRNYASIEKEAVLTIDRSALGIPKEVALCAVDMVPGTPALLPVTDDWRVRLGPEGARAFWVGTRLQGARRGFRLAKATIEKIERLFAFKLNEAVELAERGVGSEPMGALALSQALQQHATEIQQRLKTKAPVDLAKLIFRLRTNVSLVPAAVLGIDSHAVRVHDNAARGAITRIAWRLSNRSRGALRSGPIRSLDARVLSPWPEVADQCQVAVDAHAIGTGEDVSLDAQLFVPADPARRLMPYLLEVRGTVDGDHTFTLNTPVDLFVADPVEVTVAPKRAFRGQERRLALTLKNRLDRAGTMEVKLAAPAKSQVTPAAVSLQLPPSRTAEADVTLVLEDFARLGSLRIPYTITSDDESFSMKGHVELAVSDPVPQISIGRTATPPTIDGKLDEQAWSEPTTIPELRLLANADPATEKTAVWVTYDDRGLYIAFRCKESQMGKLQAKLTDRGSPLYRDDGVEIFILPPGATASRQFAINPLGTRSDNFGNQADWRAAASRSAKEWTVEAFIPYTAAGASKPPRKNAAWAMQFGRQQKAKRETTSWTPGGAFNVPSGFGEVVFE